MNILDELGLKYGTDKASNQHNYLNKYEKYIPFGRGDKLRVLEIGVYNGESLRMWKEYFYNAEIVGIDINPDCKKHEESRITIEIGDQDNFEFMYHDIGEKYKTFDLIIDDGSHLNDYVIHTFETLFNFLSSGGIYIVEDCCTSYWEEFGGGFGKKCVAGTGGCAAHGTMIEHFKMLVDTVNYFGVKNIAPFPTNFRREDYLDITLKTLRMSPMKIDIESINFLNSIIIITRK